MILLALHMMYSKYVLTHDCNICIMLSPSLLNGTGTINGDLHSVCLNRSNIFGSSVSNL
jgi:hypothetical protein